MKNKKLIGLLAGLMLVSQFSIVAKESREAAIERLVKVAKKRQAEGTLNQPEEVMVIEEEVTTTTVEDGGKTKKVTTVKKKAQPKKKEVRPRMGKNLTESQKMDIEVQRISKRVNEINQNIEKFKRNEALLDQMERRLEGIQDQLNK